MFKLGYNTNGFCSHSLADAVDIIGSLGYRSIAITIDHHSLNPFETGLDSRIRQVKEKLEAHQLACMIETGARFLLNPFEKHEPTLVSSTRDKRDSRKAFIERCLYIAAQLEADGVSIWSGKLEPAADKDRAWDWLVSGCRDVCRTAAGYGVPIAFEPEPGMMVADMEQYTRLKKAVSHDHFKLTLDLGHAFITEKNLADTLNQFGDDMVNIHLEDMKKPVHDHLFFGDGEMDFSLIFNTLRDIDYSGQVNIELSRHSHDAVNTARQALQFVSRYI